MINEAKDRDELLLVWEMIKQYKLYEDALIMGWYDLKYNLIGNI